MKKRKRYIVSDIYTIEPSIFKSQRNNIRDLESFNDKAKVLKQIE